MSSIAAVTGAFFVLCIGLLAGAHATTPPGSYYEVPAIAPYPTLGCAAEPMYTVQCNNLTGFTAIVVDSYYAPNSGTAIPGYTDGAGGYFLQNGTGCAPPAVGKVNGGTIIGDSVGNCFYRASTPNDVRQWGALCDVQWIPGGKYSAGVWGGAVWDSAPTHNWIQIPSSQLPTGTAGPQQHQFVSVTQIGPATPSGGTSIAPTWADRWSTLGNRGTNYRVGDLVAFKAFNPSMHGQFTQQVSIVVDQVGTSAASANALTSGPIWKWHFVSGGQYTQLPSTNTDGSMPIDTGFSCLGPIVNGTCTGTDNSATFIPSWSGWSVQDQGTNIYPAGATFSGSGVTVGQQVTLNFSGGTPLQGHFPKLVVMSVSGSPAAMTSWQWLDYGSYASIPSSAVPLIQCTVSGTSCSTVCTSCVQMAPEWTRGTLATTISNVYTNTMGCPTTPVLMTCIQTTDNPQGVQGSQPIEAFYYGDDDGVAINKALANIPNGQSVHITGYCGTTQAISLPDNPGATTPSNTSLVGDSYKSAGVFAFAWDLVSRGVVNKPLLMNHLIYGPVGKLAFGGGIRDLEIEGLGVPQGIGYYYNSVSGSSTGPGGYVGPALPTCGSSTTNGVTSFTCIPITGSIVEVDQAKEAIFTDLAVYDAYGEGNAMFQSGASDADPTSFLGADFGSIFLNSDRFAVTSNQQGALDPEFALRLSAHDSQYANLVAFDGTEDDVYEGKGSVYSGLHVESDVLNGAHGGSAPQQLTNWSTIPPLAGVALYGLESTKNVILSDMQCDNAWSACVFLGTAAASNSDTPSVITNIAQKCSGFANVWPTYYGVELANGTTGVSVSNVNANPSCGIANIQLVSYDSPIVDPSVQVVSQSPSAQFCQPSVGFKVGRYYTTPFTSAASASLAANTLYAIPVPIACGVTVTKLSTYVTTGASGQCRYGIYGDNGSGLPGPLILDAGYTAVTASNTTVSLPVSQPLAPGIVFLVVGCNTTPTMQGGSVTGTLLGSLLGLGSPIDTNVAVISTGWSFSTVTGLPSTFPGPTYVGIPSGNPVPLVFLTPQD